MRRATRAATLRTRLLRQDQTDGTYMGRTAPQQHGVHMQRAAGETPQPWLKLLRVCSIASAGIALVLAAAGAIAAGGEAALSAVGAVALVLVFFGITLLIGHVVGRRNPRAALGAFMFGYLIKVVGFGAVVFLLGAPAWLDRLWFLIGGVAGVVVWQATELTVFARFRFQLYDDESAPADGGDRG
ncbi:hypothetical protein GCM10022377_01200 [Zhihengliuella alba]|uniref:ATP synthase protein I n=1 Tax=Zhihengliuella alba TaxID=547018 RepID=A0ABP7CPP7_9MICC